MIVDQSYFEGMYAADPDPWKFTERWYDQRKYAVTLASLRRARYRSAYEPACSIGVLSAGLALRCDALLCTDTVETAVAAARTRLAVFPHVTVAQQALPDWPDGVFDLIVLSEVLYYLTEDDLGTVLAAAQDALVPGGDLVAVHWRHPVAEHRRTGDDVHDSISGMAALAPVATYRDPDFRLDVFTREPPPARSVAQTEGLCN